MVTSERKDEEDIFAPRTVMDRKQTINPQISDPEMNTLKEEKRGVVREGDACAWQQSADRRLDDAVAGTGWREVG